MPFGASGLDCLPIAPVEADHLDFRFKKPQSETPHLKGCGQVRGILLNKRHDQIGTWLSLVERCVRDAEAAGSNPVVPINKFKGLGETA